MDPAVITFVQEIFAFGKEKIKIPLAPFKKGETCSPFHEGGWGDLIFSMLYKSGSTPTGHEGKGGISQPRRL